MKMDKAIIKTLKSTERSLPTTGFNSRLMAEVYRAVERKKKREYILGLCLISGVSLALIGMVIFLFQYYFSVDFKFELPGFPKMHLSSETISMYGFSIYIALLTFILIGLDNFLRHVFKKRNEDKEIVHRLH